MLTLFLVRSRILSSIREVSEIPKEQQLAATLEGLSNQDIVDCDYSLVDNNWRNTSLNESMDSVMDFQNSCQKMC
jgi:hypothetical protein